jgi:microcystin-dependent protein
MYKRIDFTKLEGLAVYQDTLDFLQTSYRSAFEGLAKTFGTHVILNGVADLGTDYSDGWVVINGELLPFVGGLKDTQIVIEEITDTEVFGDDSVQTVYYTRRAKCGNVGGTDVVDFKRIDDIGTIDANLKALTAIVAAITIVPSGTMLEFGGAAAPAGFLMCDGSAVSRATYAALFAVIGEAYGVGDGATTFNVPNFKGKFSVGYDAADVDYNALGKVGGEKKHVLTSNEMPSHTHTYKDSYQIQNGGPGVPAPGTLTESAGAGSYSGIDGNDNNNDTFWYKNRTTVATGGGVSHENRPPFVTVNKIIKI